MADKQTRPEVTEGAAGPLIPWWAVGIAAVMLLVGVALAATRAGRERRAFVVALNGANVRLAQLRADQERDTKEVTDGYDDAFGVIQLESRQREYEQLLGYCETRPELARQVFREVLEKGTAEGRILACHMAFYLGQREPLELGDLQLIVKQLEDPKPEVQRAAQRELSNLILLRDAAKAKQYETFPTPPGVQGELTAKTQTGPAMDAPAGVTWLTVRWSAPEACRAWWQAFGPKAAWDGQLKRFVIAD